MNRRTDEIAEDILLEIITDAYTIVFNGAMGMNLRVCKFCQITGTIKGEIPHLDNCPLGRAEKYMRHKGLEVT